MFLNRKKQRSLEKEPSYTSVKPTMHEQQSKMQQQNFLKRKRPTQFQNLGKALLHNIDEQINQFQKSSYGLHYNRLQNPPGIYRGQQLRATNSQQHIYNVVTKGDGDNQYLFKLNFSPLPGQVKTFITVLALNTQFLNYASYDFPVFMELMVDQISGTYDVNNNPTHVIAGMGTSDPPSVIVNTGGVVGFNANFKMFGQPITYEITGIPQLTFRIKVLQDTSVTYPLSQYIISMIQITRVIQ